MKFPIKKIALFTVLDLVGLIIIVTVYSLFLANTLQSTVLDAAYAIQDNSDALYQAQILEEQQPEELLQTQTSLKPIQTTITNIFLQILAIIFVICYLVNGYIFHNLTKHIPRKTYFKRAALLWGIAYLLTALFIIAAIRILAIRDILFVPIYFDIVYALAIITISIIGGYLFLHAALAIAKKDWKKQLKKVNLTIYKYLIALTISIAALLLFIFAKGALSTIGIIIIYIMILNVLKLFITKHI